MIALDITTTEPVDHAHMYYSLSTPEIESIIIINHNNDIFLVRQRRSRRCHQPAHHIAQDSLIFTPQEKLLCSSVITYNSNRWYSTTGAPERRPFTNLAELNAYTHLCSLHSSMAANCTALTIHAHKPRHLCQLSITIHILRQDVT